MDNRNLKIIAAVAENNVIGKANKIPWHIPADLRRFQSLTLTHPLIMGSKTFDSIGGPLNGRISVVLTKDTTRQNRKNVIYVRSVNEALVLPAVVNDSEPFVIGGSEIYKLFLPYCKKMEITKVYLSPSGNATFPEIDWKEWEITKKEGPFYSREKIKYEFISYKRIT